jgi:hypothetical protein
VESVVVASILIFVMVEAEAEQTLFMVIFGQKIQAVI